MKTMKLKTFFLCLMVMGCLPAAGHADTLQKAIDEALIVPLATLEADAVGIAETVHMRLSPEYKAAEKNMEVALNKFPIEDETKAKRQAVWDEFESAREKANSFMDEIIAARTTAISNAKAKARQGKKRARHCRATLKPVDDHLEIVEIVNCVQTMEAIADMCNTATEQFRVNKQLQAGIPEELDTLKGYVTQCVLKNITGFSALMIYEVRREAKDRYAGVIEKCRQENTLGVLGHEFIWPCFKGYLDMIDEPLEPAPTEISPEPAEDSETLPKVKA